MEIEEDVLKMLISLMQHVDPTGFMFSKLISQIYELIEKANKTRPVDPTKDRVEFKERAPICKPT
jgi:hypothetical protein